MCGTERLRGRRALVRVCALSLSLSLCFSLISKLQSALPVSESSLQVPSSSSIVFMSNLLFFSLVEKIYDLVSRRAVEINNIIQYQIQAAFPFLNNMNKNAGLARS